MRGEPMMTSRRVRRRGMQLIEVMMVLPILGLVLTAVALSVSGTQRSLETVQQQALDLATVDRLAQQLREDVHRAIRLPVASGPGLEIERLEGTIHYRRSGDQLVRRMQTPAGRAQATFEIVVGDALWTVARGDGVVRLAWDDGNGRKEILAAWARDLDNRVEEAP